MKRIKKAIVFVLALAFVMGLMTVSAFAATNYGSETSNLYADYSKSFYGLNGYYHAAVDSTLSSWGWTVGEVLSNDIVHKAIVRIETMNGHSYTKYGIQINSNRVSTGTQNTAMGEYAQKVVFTLNRTSAFNNIENAQWTVTHSN